MSGEIDRVANFLKSRYLHASRLWIEGCVEYYRSQQPGPQFSIFDLQNFALDQWLLVDLRSMGVGCLPNSLSNCKDIVINGQYAVQVESVRDISSSAYSQILLVRGVSTENCDATKKPSENWEPKAGRVLRLTIFDGIQEIVGMEYSLIRELDKNMTPGTKMLIIGPVRCRRGIILLEQRNIKVLGGEVDTLITVNALENVLARALNIPENPDPYGTRTVAPESTGIDQSAPRILPAESTQSHREAPWQNPRVNALQPHPSSDFPDDDELMVLQFVDVNPSRQGVPANDSRMIEEVLLDDEDDDLLLQLPVDELVSQAINDVSDQPMEYKHNLISSGPSSRISVEQSKFLKNSNCESENRTKRTKLTVLPTPLSSIKGPMSGQGRITSFLQQSTVAATSSRVVECKDEILVKWSSYFPSKEVDVDPFVYLMQLVSFPPSSGVYPIKGFLVTLLSTLEDKDGYWNLLAKLSDGSANLEVSFYPEVLDEIIGFSAAEMRVMRQRMSGNPAIKEKLKHGFQQAKKRLYDLNCIFYLQFNSENKIPTIVNIENISLKHFTLLQARLCE